jgi:hypothetical protein
MLLKFWIVQMLNGEIPRVSWVSYYLFITSKLGSLLLLITYYL